MSISSYADPSYATDSYGSGGLFFGAHGMPRCSCWISFTTNPGDTPVWVDVTAYLRAFSIKRGRTYELDQFSAGTANITLDNRDRRFDPSYTGSPYYPNVVPMRRIKLVATWGIDYTVFDGYIDGWPQNYIVPREANVTLTATDAFKVLALKKMPSSVYEYEVRKDTPVHWWRLGEQQGTTAADSGSSPINGSHLGVLNYNVTGSSPYDSDTAIEYVDPAATGGGFFTAPVDVGNGHWTIEFWTRDLISANPLAQMSADHQIIYWEVAPTVSVVTDAFGNYVRTDVTISFLIQNAAGTSVTSLTASNLSNLGTAGWHHIVITYNGATLTLYCDGTSQATHAYSSSPPKGILVGPTKGAPAGAVIANDEIAIYDYALSSARVSAHYSAAVNAWAGESSDVRLGRVLDLAGFSSSARDIDTGVATLGAAVLNSETGQSLVQQIELAEGGAFFFSGDGDATFYNREHLVGSPGNVPKATFGDNAGEQMYSDIVVAYDDTHIINEASVTRAGGTIQTASDATSQAKYLTRTFERTDVHTQTDGDSITLAQYLVARFKNPSIRVESLTVKPQRDATNLWPLVLGLDLLDVITVNRRPQGIGSAISQNVAIEGITHNVTPEVWSTTYQLGAVPPAAWRLEDATYGAIDSVGVVAF